MPHQHALAIDGIGGPPHLAQEQQEIAGPEIEVQDGLPAPLGDDEADARSRAGHACPLRRAQPLSEVEPCADHHHTGVTGWRSTALDAVVKAMARYVPPIETKMPVKPRKARGPRSRGRSAVNSEAPRRYRRTQRNTDAMTHRSATSTRGGKAASASFAKAG